MDFRINEIAIYLSNMMGDSVEAIDENTRIYHDLGVGGVDLVDFMDWFSAKYRTDTSGMDLSCLAPHEMGGRQKTPFIPITVGNLAEMSFFEKWSDWSGSCKYRRLPNI